MKLESPDNVVQLLSDSSDEMPFAKGAFMNTNSVPRSTSLQNSYPLDDFGSRGSLAPTFGSVDSFPSPARSLGQSSLSKPPLYPTTRECPSIMQCLRSLVTIRGSKNELKLVDFDKIRYEKVKYLPPMFDGEVVFKLPPSINVIDFIDQKTHGQHGKEIRW